MSIKIIERAENHAFTFNYSQPADYHFCQDSVILALFVADFLKTETLFPSDRFLDVCSGCGVVGFELSHYEKRIAEFDFIEIQEKFRAHFEANQTLTGKTDFRWLQTSYADLNSAAYADRYRLILGNPPYFLEGEGKLSSNDFQNRCRFFLDSDLATLVRGVANAITPGGNAFLLMKSGALHGRSLLRDAKLWLRSRAEASIAAEIRGTLVIRIAKIKAE